MPRPQPSSPRTRRFGSVSLLSSCSLSLPAASSSWHSELWEMAGHGGGLPVQPGPPELPAPLTYLMVGTANGLNWSSLCRSSGTEMRPAREGSHCREWQPRGSPWGASPVGCQTHLFWGGR